MNPGSLADQLSLWGVDSRPADPEMLLNFVEELAHHQSVPALAQTQEELEARRPQLQKRLRHSLGLDPWPERTALNARNVGTLERPAYKIEKLVYEAWPGLNVTAHLYLPKHIQGPGAGLVYACGHWMEAGKLAPSVQSFCASAATLGILTLVYDPIGQGERLESWRDHGHLNALLVGKSQLGFMVWESIRALDYLLSRPEVDPRRVGMTGASGGGLNTFFTTAIEDRFACAIPAAYPCTFSAAMQAERDLNWEDGADVCNQVPQVMSYAEMSDIASLFIPRPYMILSGRRDKIFPIFGVRQIASATAKYYQLCGVGERFRFGEFDEEHGYQLSLREAAYGWLKLWLQGDGDGSPIPEPELELFPDPYPVEYSAPPAPNPEHLEEQSPTVNPMPGALPGFCLPLHQDMNRQKAIDTIIQAAAQGMPEIPAVPNQRSDLPNWQAETRRRIQAVLGPFPKKTSLHTRLFNQVLEDGLFAERITYESEPGITIPGLLVMPEEWHKPSSFVVYAGEWGKQQGLRSGLIAELVGSGFGVLAIDARGVGETATTDFEAATNLLMMDRPLFGQRVWDVMRAVDFLWERCYIGPQIDKGKLVTAGSGVGGLWALYAAALDRRVAAAAAVETLYSYTCLLDHEAHYPASVYLFDVLKEFDLAHVMAACAPRPVSIRPVNGQRHACSQNEAEAALEQAKMAFGVAGAPEGSFQIVPAEEKQKMSNWLRSVLSL